MGNAFAFLDTAIGSVSPGTAQIHGIVLEHPAAKHFTKNNLFSQLCLIKHVPALAVNKGETFQESKQGAWKDHRVIITQSSSLKP